MNQYPRAEVPAWWFGQSQPKVGQEFDLVFKARVIQIEEPQIDVTQMDDIVAETLGGEIMITLLLREMRMPLSQSEKPG